jgi:hypothetical protein
MKNRAITDLNVFSLPSGKEKTLPKNRQNDSRINEAKNPLSLNL